MSPGTKKGQSLEKRDCPLGQCAIEFFQPAGFLSAVKPTKGVILEIRVGIRVDAKTFRILPLDSVEVCYVHMKWGIFTDAEENRIHMTGLPNESRQAVSRPPAKSISDILTSGTKSNAWKIPARTWKTGTFPACQPIKAEQGNQRAFEFFSMNSIKLVSTNCKGDGNCQ